MSKILLQSCILATIGQRKACRQSERVPSVYQSQIWILELYLWQPDECDRHLLALFWSPLTPDKHLWFFPLQDVELPSSTTNLVYQSIRAWYSGYIPLGEVRTVECIFKEANLMSKSSGIPLVDASKTVLMNAGFNIVLQLEQSLRWSFVFVG